MGSRYKVGRYFTETQKVTAASRMDLASFSAPCVGSGWDMQKCHTLEQCLGGWVRNKFIGWLPPISCVSIRWSSPTGHYFPCTPRLPPWPLSGCREVRPQGVVLHLKQWEEPEMLAIYFTWWNQCVTRAAGEWGKHHRSRRELKLENPRQPLRCVDTDMADIEAILKSINKFPFHCRPSRHCL